MQRMRGTQAQGMGPGRLQVRERRRGGVCSDIDCDIIGVAQAATSVFCSEKKQTMRATILWLIIDFLSSPTMSIQNYLG